MSKLNRFIKLVCDDLYIIPPKIELVEFKSKTQLASYIPSKKTLQIKNTYENILDLFFSICHELRHKYQIDNNLFDTENYKQLGELNNFDYNMQKEEIDANAYGYLMMVTVLGVEPQFNGLNSFIVNKIKLRAREINDDLRY